MLPKYWWHHKNPRFKTDFSAHPSADDCFDSGFKGASTSTFWHYYNQFTVWWDLWQTRRRCHCVMPRCNSEQTRRSLCRVSLIKSFSGSRGNPGCGETVVDKLLPVWLVLQHFLRNTKNFQLTWFAACRAPWAFTAGCGWFWACKKRRKERKEYVMIQEKNVRRGTTKAFDENFPLSRVKNPTQQLPVFVLTLPPSHTHT